MSKRFILLLILNSCWLSEIDGEHAVSSPKRIHLVVYYESLCSDSRDFFLQQLRPTMLALYNSMRVRLIPYGKAQTHFDEEGKITFTCQHGKEECYGNKIHACALQRLTASNIMGVLFAACLFDEFQTPLNIGGEKCSQQFGLNWETLHDCANGDEGSWLLMRYGQLTENLNPQLNYVPTIIMNQVQGDSDMQNSLTTRLKYQLCQEFESMANVDEKVIQDLPYDDTKSLKGTVVYVDVYYESLCPDSRSFFISELLPTANKLGAYLSVNLIPYGRAETIISENNIDFNCQHGPTECLGNKIHACVIQQTKNDNMLSVNVTSCLFEEYFQTANAERCCKKFGVPWEKVKSCAYGMEGSQLLKGYGELTNRLLPIDFIPTVALNKARGSNSYQAAILKNLSNEVCRILERSSPNLSACRA